MAHEPVANIEAIRKSVQEIVAKPPKELPLNELMKVTGHNSLSIRPLVHEDFVRLEVIPDVSPTEKNTILTWEEALEAAARLIYHARNVKAFRGE